MDNIIKTTQQKIFIAVVMTMFITSGIQLLLFQVFLKFSILLITCLISKPLLELLVQPLTQELTTTITQIEQSYQQGKSFDSDEDNYNEMIYLVQKMLETLRRQSHWIFGTTCLFGIILYISMWQIFDEETNILLKAYFIYLISNIIFHLGEFMLVCFYHFEDLQWKGFLINHSYAYNIAFIVAQLEFWLEYIYLFQYKMLLHSIIYLGIIFSLLGHFFRIGAFINAKSNFHHIVQTRKQKNHQLVTSGLYSICRHPSYFGFFMYSLGGQMILVNPVCTVVYFFVLWQFFFKRILDEEYYLVRFFGNEYVRYREKTSSLIVGIDYYLKKTRDS